MWLITPVIITNQLTVTVIRIITVQPAGLMKIKGIQDIQTEMRTDRFRDLIVSNITEITTGIIITPGVTGLRTDRALMSGVIMEITVALTGQPPGRKNAMMSDQLLIKSKM